MTRSEAAANAALTDHKRKVAETFQLLLEIRQGLIEAQVCAQMALQEIQHVTK